MSVTASGNIAGNPADVVTLYFSYVKNGVFTQIGSQTYTLNSHGFILFSGTHSASVTLNGGDALYGAITDSCGTCGVDTVTVSSITISYAASQPSTTVSYDKEHRQEQVVQGSTTTADTYDAVGNVATEIVSAAETYTYDANNELTKAAFSPTVYVSYSYDKDGNRIAETTTPNRGSFTYAYDYENRLITTVGSATTCTYTYAPTGERVSSNCGTIADYGYDYGSPGGTSNLAAQYASSGGVQDRYVQGAATDTPLTLTQGGSTYAYQTDGLGSVDRLTAANGTTAETYTYDAWGNPTAAGGVTDSLQYGAREHDASFGLYYDRARFYDPSADAGHRFLGQDPAGGGYAYAGDSPMNFVDPTGMTTCTRYCGRQGSWDGSDADPSANLCTRYCGHNGAGGMGGGTGASGGSNGGTASNMACASLEISVMLGIAGLILSAFVGVGAIGGSVTEILEGDAFIQFGYQMGALGVAIAAGDAGGIATHVIELIVSLGMAYAAAVGVWAALGFIGRLAAPWLLLGLILINLLFITVMFAMFYSQGCSWTWTTG